MRVVLLLVWCSTRQGRERAEKCVQPRLAAAHNGSWSAPGTRIIAKHVAVHQPFLLLSAQLPPCLSLLVEGRLACCQHCFTLVAECNGSKLDPSGELHAKSSFICINSVAAQSEPQPDDAM